MRTRDPEFIIPSTEGSVFPDSAVVNDKRHSELL